MKQSGNVLVFVLIAIALFGALAWTFMRGGQQGTGNMSSQKTKIAAQEILNYAQNIERAVNRIRSKGASESDLDFEGAGAAYANGNCPDTSCEIFSTGGGQQVWQAPPSGVNDGSAWVITGGLRISGVGTDGGTSSNAELVLVLPNVTEALCTEINNKLGITNPSDVPPQTAGNADYSSKFTGTFSTGDLVSATELNGKEAGCFEGNGTPADSTWHFYQVLLAR